MKNKRFINIFGKAKKFFFIYYFDMVSFQCKNDGNCCKKYWVPLTHLDIFRLHIYGKINDLINYIELHEYNEENSRWKSIIANNTSYYLSLKYDGKCIFLTNDGKCKVHLFKPFACRFYPFEYEVCGNKILIDVNEQAKKECPGLILDNSEIDKEVQEKLKKLARIRLKEIELWNKAISEWNKDKIDLEELIKFLMRKAKEDYQYLLSKKLWVM